MNTTIFRFRYFPVYKEALFFRIKLVELSKINFPNEEK